MKDEKKYTARDIADMEQHLDAVSAYLGLLIKHHADERDFLNNLKEQRNETQKKNLEKAHAQNS